MKCSVFIATYNKEKVLPNALYSLAIQKTSFPFEVCIVDDCSLINPEPIVEKFLPNAKFIRFDNHVGFISVHQECFALADGNAEVIVLQSADIIHTRIDSLETLVNTIMEKSPVFAEVVDIPIAENFHESFPLNIENILKNWENYKTNVSLNLGGNTYTCSTTYSAGLFFLGAIMKSDLNLIGFKDCGCDAVTRVAMRQHNFDIQFLPNLKAIHQRHEKHTPICPIQSSCKINCIRKSGGFKYQEQDNY